MRSVVMICHGFPPEGHAGVYRPLRFTRHLPDHGWRPAVVANEPDLYERYDPGLLDLAPPGIEIVRVRNPDPWRAIQHWRGRRSKVMIATAGADVVRRIETSHQRPFRSRLRKIVHTIEASVYHPDQAMGWIRPAVKAAVALCGRTGAEVVWATGGPWSSLVVAREVGRRTGLPYVVDFRDSWTLAYKDFQEVQPQWARRRDRRLLSRLFADAHAVVFRYRSEAEAYWRAYPGVLDPERVHLIPNGYDGPVASFAPRREERCTLLYTGTVSAYWYEPLLEALRRLKHTAPEKARQLRLVFVGEGVGVLAGMAARLDLGDLVETAGTVPFAQAAEMQRQADALLLLGWKPLPGYELVGGSKIFSYMKAGKPIVGVLPRDENAVILRSIGVNDVAYAGSAEEIADLLRRFLDAWSRDRLLEFLPDPVACRKYSAEFQTGALVRALEGRPAEEPFRPGAVPVPPSLEKLIGREGWVRPPARARGVSIQSLEKRASED